MCVNAQAKKQVQDKQALIHFSSDTTRHFQVLWNNAKDTFYLRNADKIKAVGINGVVLNTSLLFLQGSAQDYQALLECIDNSSDSNLKVKALRSWLLTQIQPQIKK